jgi:hypothetical protein
MSPPSNYDSNMLHAVCDQRGNLQLVTRRRYGPGNGTGHRRQTPDRLRSMAISESPFNDFAIGLLEGREAIERDFGNLVNWAEALTASPPGSALIPESIAGYKPNSP